MIENDVFKPGIRFKILLEKLGPFVNLPCLKDYPHNLTRYEIKGTSKIPISKLFGELEKI